MVLQSNSKNTVLLLLCMFEKKTWQEWNNADGFYYKSQDQVHFSTDKIDKVIFILGHCPNSIYLDGKNI